MCGKYMKMENLLETIIGSPPHVREVLIKWNLYNNIMGITPACAGSTQNLKTFKKRGEDHPRMCGKYQPLGVLHNHSLGSPPHVREVPYLPFYAPF